MSVAIKVENLSKKYIIQHEKKSANYETLSESLIQGGKHVANRIIRPFSKTPNIAQTEEEFWALKDINFEINQGDKIGIIGRNGAGKSTLLKVLSRITEPTSGKIHINGRIASLLEVGTGFHPELTGRENIFLNGAILGMSRQEIRKKFDEIVAFAEVEKFLDTPVKRYSSGMYVRLAFAVAAHLESEILIVDEVLAVGDQDFQKKCLGKMDDVSKAGRTILFVSHNFSAIQRLCNKSILLDKGAVICFDSTLSTMELYYSSRDTESLSDNLSLLKRADGMGGEVAIDRFYIINSKLKKANIIKFGETFHIEISVRGFASMEDLQMVVGIDSIMGERIATTIHAKDLSFELNKDEVAVGKVFLKEYFVPGTYNITLAVRQHKNILVDKLKSIGTLVIEPVMDDSCIDEVYLPGGYFHLQKAKWTIEKNIGV